MFLSEIVFSPWNILTPLYKALFIRTLFTGAEHYNAASGYRDVPTLTHHSDLCAAQPVLVSDGTRSFKGGKSEGG